MVWLMKKLLQFVIFWPTLSSFSLYPVRVRIVRLLETLQGDHLVAGQLQVALYGWK